ncbi:hypothetical protein CDL12_24076 [Handroanthus impetiginosus]|uniref:Uncharacterized protein n=1 Tax=Handroanthus impetiginosus TaxID=429701 RepID=A0A2G9GDN8_9LAMI|nr:hypothetical protein CDL12_24076 [Handroanthus impetiginosus]
MLLGSMLRLFVPLFLPPLLIFFLPLLFPPLAMITLIWEKIDSIRAIVGFKARRHSSYSEELKALYLFTGIEPTSSSMEQSDLREFYNKRRFLMSVINLK